MKPIPQIALPLQGRLVVSCQALEDSAFHSPECMARFAIEAVAGGAAGVDFVLSTSWERPSPCPAN